MDIYEASNNMKKHEKYITSSFKCGLIFCVNFTEFVFHCTLCDRASNLEVMNFESYAEHVRNHLDKFNLKEDESEILQTVCLEESDNFSEESVVDIMTYDGSDTDATLDKREEDDQYLTNGSNDVEFIDPLYADNHHKYEANNEEVYSVINIDVNITATKDKIPNEETTTSQTIYADKINVTQQNSKIIENIPKPSKKSQYICDACGKILQSIYKLKVHMRSHSGKNPYSCKKCGKSYRYAQNLNRHLVLHENSKPFPCEYCEKSYSSKDALKNHTSLHTGAQKKYKCKLCDKSFGVPAYLDIHMRIHTGEKPFQCKFCHARFMSKASLTYKHQPCPELKFKCKICNNRYFTEIELSMCTHIPIQKNVKPAVSAAEWNCDKCTKCFKSCEALNTHIKIHNLPFLCKICDKGFPNDKSLDTHVKYFHNRIRPYVCEICQSSFLTSVSLRKHKVRHSNNKTYKC